MTSLIKDVEAANAAAADLFRAATEPLRRLLGWILGGASDA